MANHGTRVRRHVDRQGAEARSRSFSTHCLSLENLIDPMGLYVRRQAVQTEEEQPEIDADRLRRREGARASPSRHRYMEPYINPREALEQRASGEARRRQLREARELPGAADARHPRFPAPPRSDRGLAGRLHRHRARGGLLLRTAGDDQDHQRGLGVVLSTVG